MAPSKTGAMALKLSRAGRPAQVRLQNLAHVHTARHAQRVEQNVDRRAVGQERHVLFGQDLRNHSLVAVPAGHLVADGDLPFGGHVDLDHLLHAAGQLVAALERVEPAFLLVDQELQPFAVLVVDRLGLLDAFRRTDVQIVQLERGRPARPGPCPPCRRSCS